MSNSVACSRTLSEFRRDPDFPGVKLLVEVAGISDRFASALLGTLFGLAFHPIKNRMEHTLRRYTNLDQMKRKWNAPTDDAVSREA
jgi:hypothetical protein